MPRYYAPISIIDLKKKIEDILFKTSLDGDYLDSGSDYEKSQRYFQFIRTLTPTIIRDFEKVEVDTENVIYERDDVRRYEPGEFKGTVELYHIMEYCSFDNLTFFGFYCGGDWEIPVYHIIYWDGKQLRGYIPEDGNTYNRISMQAYGNDEELDEKDGLSYEGGGPDFDSDKLYNDIRKRLQLKPGA